MSVLKVKKKVCKTDCVQIVLGVLFSRSWLFCLQWCAAQIEVLTLHSGRQAWPQPISALAITLKCK